MMGTIVSLLMLIVMGFLLGVGLRLSGRFFRGGITN